MEQHRHLLHPLQRAQTGKNAVGSRNDPASSTKEATVDSKDHVENKSFQRPTKLEGLPLLEYGNRGIGRREFAVGALRMFAGTAMLLSFPSCKKVKKTPTAGVDSPQSVAARGETYFAPRTNSFPMFEVRGKPYEIGLQIGRRFATNIKKGFELRAAWWKDLKQFATSDPSRYEIFLAAAKKYAPAVIEELRGWADGSGIPFADLVILNLKAEYQALKDEADQKVGPTASGCSTIVSKNGNRVVLAHNEDGDAAYLEHMFLLRVRTESGREFLCASYPGILPGNAPWANDAGIIMTTNFIYSKKVKLGVGRYFLDRLAMEAPSLKEALKICRHPERAYAFHHVIISVPEGRAVSLEVTADRDVVSEITGLFIHTNHLITPQLAGETQDLQYVTRSSLTRWNVLEKWKGSLRDIATVGRDDILRALSSHEGKPYSPCRHPEGDITGATLLMAYFEVARGEKEVAMDVYRNQPCLGRFTTYRLPLSL